LIFLRSAHSNQNHYSLTEEIKLKIEYFLLFGEMNEN